MIIVNVVENPSKDKSVQMRDLQQIKFDELLSCLDKLSIPYVVGADIDNNSVEDKVLKFIENYPINKLIINTPELDFSDLTKLVVFYFDVFKSFCIVSSYKGNL